MTHNLLENDTICRPGDESDPIVIVPAFQGQVPRLSPGELADLHHEIDLFRGCYTPLIVWKGKNWLIDGYNRLPYCREKGYPFPVRYLEFADETAVKKFIIKKQMGQRNLSDLAMSYFRGQRYEEMKHQGRQDETSRKSCEKKTTTADVLGDFFAVSARTISNDHVFMLAVNKIVEDTCDEARDLLLAREKKLKAPTVRLLAKAPTGVKHRYIEALKSNKEPPTLSEPTTERKTVSVALAPLPLVRLVLRLMPEMIAEFKKLFAEEEAKLVKV